MTTKKLFLIVFAIVIAKTHTQAQETSQFAVEIDPAPYILNGRSFSVKYSPRQAPNMACMFSVYQSDFPDNMMIKANKDQGWKNVKLETSYAAFIEFYFNNERKGFYFGPSVFLYNKSAELIKAKERSSFSTIYPNARVGYIWYPFKKIDLYLNPWLNMGSEINLNNEKISSEAEFKPSKFNYILALHIGYSIRL